MNHINPFSWYLRCCRDVLSAYITVLELSSSLTENMKTVDYHDVANNRRKKDRRDYWQILDEQERMLKP
jgi:hypothetical protein